MRMIRGWLVAPMLAMAALSLSACGGIGDRPPSTASTPPPAEFAAPVAVSAPVDQQAVVFGYQALETVTYGIDALVAVDQIKTGSPTANRLADALHGTLTWLNTAKALQDAKQDATAAWEQAKAGLANLRTTLAGVAKPR